MDLTTLQTSLSTAEADLTQADKRNEDAARLYLSLDLEHDGSDKSHTKLDAADKAQEKTRRDLEAARRRRDTARDALRTFEQNLHREERNELERLTRFDNFTDSLVKQIDAIRDARLRLARGYEAVMHALANRGRQVSRLRELGGDAEAVTVERVARFIADLVTRDARDRHEPIPSIDVSKKTGFGDFVEHFVTVHHAPFFGDGPRRQAEQEATAYLNRNTNPRGPKAA